MSDFEKILFDISDSTKMKGIGDRLESIIAETKASIDFEGARRLCDYELDMVAGGTDPAKYLNKRK